MVEKRPELNRTLDGKTFLSYYYLKEELIAFCRTNGLPVSGGKLEITERIAHYLDTGEILSPRPAVHRSARTKKDVGVLTPDTPIEPDFVCSETHRAFFKEIIGPGFSFHVAFQKWLKTNTGKTYAQAVEAYHRLAEEKKKGKTVIDRQFEYNTYIRDFFADNPGRTLDEAIRCWKYKKNLPGHNRYEASDLNRTDEA